jgi:integrase
MRTGKLPDNAVNTTNAPGRYADGGGLYLVVTRHGTKSWAFRYMLHSQAHELGLGSVQTFSLREARERARKIRQQLADGVDPLAAKQAARLAAIRSKTFAEVAELFVVSREPGWKGKGAGHSAQAWRSSFRDHVFPHIGEMGIGDVRLADVMRVLQPIWHTQTETADRVRGRIEGVLDFAKASGWRSGDNPAKWKGHLDKLLPKPSDVSPPEPYVAMHYREVPGFVAALKAREGIAAKALRLLILTAARSGEVRNATWDEFRFEQGVWRIPPDHHKLGKRTGKPKIIPLSRDAIEVLREVGEAKAGDVVFSAMGGKPISDVAMSKMLPHECECHDPHGWGKPTVHGFRTSFRTWAQDETSYPREMVEMALGHLVGNDVEQRYARGDMVKRRAALMEAWADWCLRRETEGKVVAFPA